MGQPVAVTEKPSATPGVVRFETNRSLTGMGHERYESVTQAIGATPGAEVARRLFATGRVTGVHVYGNTVTVELARGYTTEGLATIVANLYQYWKPGMKPPSFEELTAAAETTTSATSAESGAGGGAEDAGLSEAAKRVPAHLLERSRLARERWKAKQG